MSDSNVEQSTDKDSSVTTNKDNPYSSKRTRNYVLVLLTIVYTFNFIDRQLLSILQEAIKADLLLSDAQLGLLTGFAFAMFYVTAGIPIAPFGRPEQSQKHRRYLSGSLEFYDSHQWLCSKLPATFTGPDRCWSR